MLKKHVLLTLAVIIIPAILSAQTAPVNTTLQNASVNFVGDSLIVNTGLVERTYHWTGKGFVTTSLENLTTKQNWVNKKPTHNADWSLPGLIDNNSNAKLIFLTAEKSDDQGFTSKHIQVIAEIEYPKAKIAIQYIIWVYPNSPGLRTQVAVKALPGFDPAKITAEPRRAEYLPIDFKNLSAKTIGYYNDTQHRNYPKTELLKEEFQPAPIKLPQTSDSSSILSIQTPSQGFCLIKESHKCVNQKGYDTGHFALDNAGISATGWGIMPADIIADHFRIAWANWIIVYKGADDDRQLAIKKFDRIRYPIDPDRDIYILANTWGSGNKRKAAIEGNVLTEIQSAAELGIDALQIDDGWQVPPGLTWQYTVDWLPYPTRYPQGWKNVVHAAKRHNIDLGLWVPSGMHAQSNLDKYGDVTATDAELRANYDAGHFKYYKFDFSFLKDYQAREDLVKRTRDFILYTNHSVRVNWDVTENEPRIGYYYAREYGNIFLSNRMLLNMPHADYVYIPHLMLREAWQVAKYLNLNKFQVNVQNIDLVLPTHSDAYKHNHPYTVAIALMANPLFFQETHYYSHKARKEIRDLLTIYKKYRDEIYQGYVFPISEKPDNKSWPAFQCHLPNTNAGYLMIFRELENKQTEKQIMLKFLAGKTIKIKNLITNEKQTKKLNNLAQTTFNIENPANFLFLRYEIE
jgi:hypothetical protein